MKIAFIGGGVMAEAILGGILDADIAEAGDVRFGEPVESRRAYLAETYGVHVHEKNAKVLNNADLVVLAIKPQQLGDVMDELQPWLSTDQTVLSIVAGATVDTLIKGLKHPTVVRVMPNTPTQVRQGMTVWTASDSVPADRVEATRLILGTLGEELQLSDEKLMDAVTALSASGPAYVFLFIEALIDAGVYMGMPRDMSRTLVLQTVLGSTKYVQDTGQHPAELKDMVSSPAGGTVEALMAFESSGFRAAVLGAVNAAFEKYQALGRQD